MKMNFFGHILMAAVLVAGAGLAQAADKPNAPVAGSSAAIAKQVRHDILTYPHYTLWDDIGYRIDNGQVVLSGAVTQPYKKSDIERMVKGIPGVTSIENDIKVLPLSPMDNQLRQQVARAIFSEPSLSRYSMGAIPSIHIIVDNGHVTLKGVVMNQMDKQLAGIRANSTLSFGVQNDLQVENPSGHKS
ncbi:MAG TPA: BON domain-containing protein [Bryobacteraceae bacterium]|nr:BON domain-containing protein [Bryobacteraceae bacterium]